MKKLFFLIAIISNFIACDHDDELEEGCAYEEWPTIENAENSIIPLNTQNFWVYADSSWENGQLEFEQSTLIKIERIYDFDGYSGIDFNELLPLLILKNDTLYSAARTPNFDTPNCYEIYYPKFFYTEDSIQVDSNPSEKFVYKSTKAVETNVGTFSDNIVFKEGGSYEIITHPGLGIIKFNFYISIDDQKNVKRSLTLKDYNLY